MAPLGPLGDGSVLGRVERDDRVTRVEDCGRWQRDKLARLNFDIADIRGLELDAIDDEDRFVTEFEVDVDSFLLVDLNGILDR